jgi:hypothetical protein
MQLTKKITIQLMQTLANEPHCTFFLPSTRPMPATAPTMHCVVETYDKVTLPMRKIATLRYISMCRKTYWNTNIRGCRHLVDTKKFHIRSGQDEPLGNSIILTTNELANPAVDPRVGDSAKMLHEMHVQMIILCLNECDSTYLLTCSQLSS